MRDRVTEMESLERRHWGFMPADFLLRPVSLKSGFLSFYLARSISITKKMQGEKGQLQIILGEARPVRLVV